MTGRNPIDLHAAGAQHSPQRRLHRARVRPRQINERPVVGDLQQLARQRQAVGEPRDHLRRPDRPDDAAVTVDDDPAVSRAVARDLRRHYVDKHRIVRGLERAGRSRGICLVAALHVRKHRVEVRLAPRRNVLVVATLGPDLR